MGVFTRTTKNIIIKIDEFIDDIDIGLLVFKEAMKSYLDKDLETFERQFQKLNELENSADRLQREIENEMIIHSVLPQSRDEVVALIDMLDEIIDSIQNLLRDIDIERPVIPDEINNCFYTIVVASANAAEELVPAARAYFRSPYTVREKLLKVYYFESETDKFVAQTKKKIFREMNYLHLAEKNQLRYIINNIENISDYAQKAADKLSGMAVKIFHPIIAPTIA
jgi:predicted phosphate transport protein (TIGR00153 family)